MILGGEGFSVGMLFAFLSFRQTFTDRAIGFINQAVQFRLMGLHLERLVGHRHRGRRTGSFDSDARALKCAAP